jgi:hypothetical protein
MRLLNALHPPASFPPQRWADIQPLLRNDDKWDPAAFDATQTKGPVPIFAISDSLRQQVLYWKDRRNDCAHSKGNEIGAAHVEAIWLFIQSNLAKFVANGGRAGLLDKIEQHFDLSVTPPGTSIVPLAQELATAVEPQDLPAFLVDLKNQIDVGGLLSYRRHGYLNAVLRELQFNSVVCDAVVQSIASDPQDAVSFLSEHPEHLLLFQAADPQTVRRIWYEWMGRFPVRRLPLFCAILRNGLIPANELSDAVTRLVRQLSGEVPKESQLDVLNAAGFVPTFKRYAFEEGNIHSFGWGNSNSDSVVWFIETQPIDETVVRSVQANFSQDNHPYALRNALNSFFLKNTAKRDEFRSVAHANGVSLPTKIPSLL